MIKNCYILETLQDNIDYSKLVTENNGEVNLYFDSHKILAFTPGEDTIYEHLGYFYNLSKKLKLPYQKCLDAFETHYRKLLKDVRK